MNTIKNKVAALLNIPAETGVYALLDKNERVEAIISYKPINESASSAEGVYDALEVSGKSNACFTGGRDATSDVLKMQFAKRFLSRGGNENTKKSELIAAFERISADYKCSKELVTASMLAPDGTLKASSWAKVNGPID